MEGLQVLALLTQAHEVNRLARHRPDRERRAATRVAVQLGQADPVDADLAVKKTGRIHRVLTRHGVGHQEGIARL